MVTAAAIVLVLAAAAMAASCAATARRVQRAAADRDAIAAMIAGAPAEEDEEAKKPQSARAAELARAGIEMTPAAWYGLVALAALFAAAVSWLVFMSPLICGIALIGAVLLFRTVKKSKAAKSQDLFSEQLAAALPQVASNMRSGMTVERAIRAVGEHMDEPLKSELTRATTRLAYGTRLDAALADAAEHTGSSDLALVATAVSMQQDSGGDLAEVLDRIAEKVRSKLSLRRHVKSVTSSARASRTILALIPWVAMLLTTLSTDAGFEFWRTFAGTCVIAVVIVLEVCGTLVMNKIIDMKIE